MKKVFLLIGILFTLILTTGCVKSAYYIDLSNPKDLSMSISVGFKNSFLNSMGVTSKDLLSDEETNYKADGYEVKTFTDDSYTGISASKKYKDLEEFNTTPLPVGFSSNEPILIKKGFLNTTYTVDLTYDLRAANQNMTNNQSSNYQYNDEQMEAFFNQYPDMKPTSELTIKLPTKAKINNADKVTEENNEYTWDLAKSTKEPVKIELVYTQTQTTNLAILFVGIVLIIMLVAKLVIK